MDEETEAPLDDLEAIDSPDDEGWIGARAGSSRLSMNSDGHNNT